MGFVQYSPANFFDIGNDLLSFCGVGSADSVWVNHDDSLVVIVTLVCSWRSGEGICCGVGFSRDVLNFIVVFL